MWATLNTLFACGTVLILTFVILLALPQSHLRKFLLPILSWLFAIFSGLYTLSPIDLMPEAFLGPFGLGDDLLAIIAGVQAIRTAHKAAAEEVVS